MPDTQKWLDENYPSKERKEIEILDISRELLEGHLKLEGFINLRELDCSNNQLTSLTLINLKNLKELHCDWNKLVSLSLDNTNNNLKELSFRDNKLTDLGFLKSLNYETLEVLNILNNDFYEQDLSFSKKFVNLKKLSISNNRFTGSLEPLKNMNKLESLSIESTDIDSGLEYLPDSIWYLGCGDSKPGSKVKKISRELRKHGKPSGYNYANLFLLWKKANNKKTEKIHSEFQKAEKILKKPTQTGLANVMKRLEKQLWTKNQQIQKTKNRLELLDKQKQNILNRYNELWEKFLGK